MIIQSKVHDPPGTLGLEVYGSFGSLGGRVLVFFFLCVVFFGFGVWSFPGLGLCSFEFIASRFGITCLWMSCLARSGSKIGFMSPRP